MSTKDLTNLILDSTKGPMIEEKVLIEGKKYMFEEWDGCFNEVTFRNINKDGTVLMVYLSDNVAHEVAYNYAASKVTEIQ